MSASSSLSSAQFGGDPGQQPLYSAQSAARGLHPELARPLQDAHEATGTLRSWLREAGHPDADRAYVVRREDSPTSNTGRGPAGEPVVGLHPGRFDLGTLAHEAAHHIRDLEAGRQAGDPQPPGGAHGHEYVRHYARLIGGRAGRDLSLMYSRQRSQQREPG